MADRESSIGGKLTLGTETPQQDVIDGWNFKVEGTGAGGTGAQALELDGLVPFVQLIGLYDKNEIDKLLGTGRESLRRTVEFVGSGRGAYDFGDDDWNTYKGKSEEQVRSFEDKIKNNYIKIFLTNEHMGEGEATKTNGIVLATNSAQAGNDAYEVINDIGTPKDSGGVGITDLQIETGTKDFLNRRYKLRMTITDPQVLDDKPEYVKLATLQSMFLIIHGWSNIEQLTAWPAQFEPAPVITNVGGTDEDTGEEFPNGLMTVDMSHKKTGGAWGAALVATTMYDFAFNEVGQLEATFTFMPREISFMHTMRIPTVATIIQQVLNSGQTSEPFDPRKPEPKPRGFAGYTLGVGNVATELGKNLIDIIAEEQAAYVQDNPTISSLFGDRFDGSIAGESTISLTDKLAEWSKSEDQWDSTESVSEYYERQRRERSTARFPHAGVGIGTFMATHETVGSGEEAEEYIHYTNRVNYYYLGWILEAMRFSLWDLNKGKASRGETPYDLKFRYMGVPRNSAINYAVQDELSQGIIPSVAGFTSTASIFLQKNCMPPEPPMVDPREAILNIETIAKWPGYFAGQGFHWITPVTFWALHNILYEFGYQLLNPDETGSGRGSVPEDWETLSREEKIARIPDGDYRKSLVVTDFQVPTAPGNDGEVVRILHPDFENQILYNTTMAFGDRAWRRWNGGGKRPRRLEPKGVRIAGQFNDAKPSAKLVEIMKLSKSNKALPGLAGQTNAPIVAGMRTPGQGFWYEKESGKYIGEGIFAMKKDGWKPMIGGRSNWGDDDQGTRLRGASDRFENFGSYEGKTVIPASRTYSGDASTALNQSQLGILMPAVSARYFSLDKYKILQKWWYQRHLDHLSEIFPEIIKKRIAQAIEQGLTMDDLAAEPVDLFWLTGKKYNRSGHYHSMEWMNENVPNTLSGEEQVDLGRLETEKGKLTKELEKINIELGSTESIVEEDSILRNKLETATTQFLDNPQNLSMFNSLSDAEDQFEEPILGRLNKIRFWESRIKVILIELISKDLITMGRADFPELADQTYTVSSAYVAPPAIRQLTRDNTSGDLWIDNPVITAPQPIPTNVFGGVALLGNYEVIIVNPNVIINVGQSYRNLMFSAKALERGQEYSVAGFDTGYIIPHNWAQMKESGAARYAGWDFGNVGFATGYNIGLPAVSRQGVTVTQGGISPWSELSRGYSDYSPNIIVDMIGAFGEGTSEAIRQSTTLNQRQIEARASAADAVTTSSRNAYIFMNWAPQSMRDKYVLPAEMLMNITGSQEEVIWTEVNKQYDDYISNCRALLKKYISKKDSFNERIIFLQTEQIRVANGITLLQNDIDSIYAVITRRRSESNRPLSPFGPTIQGDAAVTESLGGGRKMNLNGPRAQQIAQRFTKSIVFGAGDIQNYGPPPGGILYNDSNGDKYGWANMTETFGVPGWDNEQGEMINAYPANLPGNTATRPGRATPMQIAYLLQQDGWNPARRTKPGTNEANTYYIEPNGENNKVNKEGWKGQNRGRTVREFAESNQIDRDLLFALFATKYDKNLTIEEPTVFPAALVLDRVGDVDTMGAWTTYIDMSMSTETDPNMPGLATAGVERWALYVDEDLDFIVPKVHLTGIKSGSNSHQNNNFFDTYPNKWYKLPWRFTTAADANYGAVKLYPKASGARMAEDDHLPTLTESAVQQLVRIERNGYSGAPAIEHELVAPFAGNGQISYGARAFPSNYAANPTAAYRGNEIAKSFQSAYRGWYNSSGRTEATTAFPFGIPFRLTVGDYDPETYNTGSTKAVGIIHGRSPTNGAPGSWGRLSNIHVDEDTGVRFDPDDGIQLIDDILRKLPPEFEYGFQTSVNNANADFSGGAVLNRGVQEWIANYYINLLPYGRRVAIAPKQAMDESTLGDYESLDEALKKDDRYSRDVCWGDLFSEVVTPNDTTVDFGNKTVENVAEIPIKRDVVDNLLNRQNTNMSLMQFVQQLITPSSIGVAGNIQIAGRNRNGIMELAVASVDYRGISHDLIKSSEKAFYGDAVAGMPADSNRQPTDQLLFDYKRRNSLIENIDMSSKMDPAAFLTYQNSSSMIHGPGRDYNILKLLSYEGIAEEFQEYLAGVPDVNNAGETHSGIVNIGYGNKVTVDRVKYSKLSPTILDGFVAQNPERWAKITSMMQGQNNFTTDLLAFYMRSVTLTIHGLTNISPFNLINVKGVMPSLEGIYLVTNVTDRITPGGFQTILEGKLIRRKDRINEEIEEAREEARVIP